MLLIINVYTFARHTILLSQHVICKYIFKYNKKYDDDNFVLCKQIMIDFILVIFSTTICSLFKNFIKVFFQLKIIVL